MRKIMNREKINIDTSEEMTPVKNCDKKFLSGSDRIWNNTLFMSAISVIITVLASNFLGDGLRDAADPHAK